MEENKSRRISLGKSFSIEHCIKTLEKFFVNNFDAEEFNINVINHELPGEFRSVMWRIFLGILSTPYNKKNWILITKTYRGKIDTNFCDENFLGALEYYTNLLQEKKIENKFTLNFDFEKEFSSLRKELKILADDYDLFKSPSIHRTFLSIFLNWRIKNNYQLNPIAISFLCKIIGMLIYTLYPCSIHLNQNFDEINDNEEDLKNIFYFLNLEDFFEHDLSEILEKLINSAKLKDYIFNYSEDHLPHLIDLTGNEENFDELFEKKINLNEKDIQGLNFIEEISYRFLHGINKETTKNLLKKGINLYDQVVAKYYLSLMFEATKFENIGYYMDNILIYFAQEEFNFVGCLIMSTFILLEDQYSHLTKENVEKFFSSYPLLKVDPKEIIGKAMKIREKISEKFGK